MLSSYTGIPWPLRRAAVEGLELAFEGLERWVVPLSLIVLVGYLKHMAGRKQQP